MRIAFALILGMSLPALGSPEMIVRLGKNEVRIQTETCKDKKVLSYVKDDYHPHFKKARVIWEGKEYSACWMVLPSGEVLILDEAGDHGTLPQSSFKPVAWI